MKNFLWSLIAVTLFAMPAFAKKDKLPELRNDRVYVMYLKSCPMCQKALKYIDEKYNGSLYIIKANLATQEGRDLLNQCRQKHDIKDVVIPMFCAGDEFTMGWSKPTEEKIDGYMNKLSF